VNAAAAGDGASVGSAGRADDRTLDRRLDDGIAALDARRLQRRFVGVTMSRIADVVERRPVRFGGEVQRQYRSAPGSTPVVRVTVSDGTASAVAVFSGRSRIRGIDVGRAIVFEGVARRERDRLIVYNPAYTLLA